MDCKIASKHDPFGKGIHIIDCASESASWMGSRFARNLTPPHSAFLSRYQCAGWLPGGVTLGSDFTDRAPSRVVLPRRPNRVAALLAQSEAKSVVPFFH